MAVDYFLKIDGIEGESQDDKHKNEIDVLSWSWAESNAGTASGSTGAGAGAGKVAMQDFHFTMRMNKATPKLLEACATGKHHDKATLICRRAGEKQQEYLKIEFKEVLVSSYQTGGSSGDDGVPVESVSLNFAEIKMDYCPQKKDGTLDGAINAGYNVKQNKKV